MIRWNRGNQILLNYTEILRSLAVSFFKKTVEILSQTQTMETSFHPTDPDTSKTDARFNSRVWYRLRQFAREHQRKRMAQCLGSPKTQREFVTRDAWDEILGFSWFMFIALYVGVYRILQARQSLYLYKTVVYSISWLYLSKNFDSGSFPWLKAIQWTFGSYWLNTIIVMIYYYRLYSWKGFPVTFAFDQNRSV